MKAISGIHPRAGTVTLWPLAEAFRKPSRSSAPFLCQNSIQHLVLAFFAGVLLTLLLVALIFFIRKSYRKCHSSPWALNPPLDPPSSRDPPAKLSSPEEALTYASVAFKISEEESDHLTKKHSAPLEPDKFWTTVWPN
uniref:transmembrane protein C1orf162 homolog n=1 Tax=Odobenus rosmarus divergens TaxID=9708 RepID=UPI00063CB3BF|nr:PREDICTED: transmembrane protein C1orf162 homolog [Odobenus rosmarus divergens]